MRNIGRIGDSAGGKIISGANSVSADGLLIALLNSPVQGHGTGRHGGTPRMVEGSASVECEARPVCRLGDHASCGHPLTSSSSVEVG